MRGEDIGDDIESGLNILDGTVYLLIWNFDAIGLNIPCGTGTCKW
ncbi:hypothetical protein K340107D12_60450 [Blautia parvula]|uniref:Uncharacterized protein n=1 Tax=Blautia parvula TaxID=2877527 RepID=A0ABQ0C362_9FIRM